MWCISVASRFGGQPYFNDFLANNYKASFTNAFGEKNGKAMMAATAGSYVSFLIHVLVSLEGKREREREVRRMDIMRLYQLESRGQILTSLVSTLNRFTGIGEIVLLPLDVLKIKMQYVTVSLAPLPCSSAMRMDY